MERILLDNIEKDSVVDTILTENIDNLYILLEQGIDVNMYTKEGWNIPFYVSMSHLHEDIMPMVRLLLDNGSDPNSRSRVGNNETLLMWVATIGYIDVSKLLIEYGGDIYLEDTLGKTVWDHAKEMNDDIFLNFLSGL